MKYERNPWTIHNWAAAEAEWNDPSLPPITLGVLNYNRRDHLRQTLDVLTYAVQYPRYEIILIDNGSTVAAGATWFMTANAAEALVVVIVEDLLLIPSLGAIGATTSKLIAVTLGAGTIVWLSRNSLHFNARGFTLAFARTAIAAVAVLAAGWLLMPLLGMLVRAFLILIVYSIAIHYTRVLPLKEVIFPFEATPTSGRLPNLATSL